jgi:hypothetical protein
VRVVPPAARVYAPPTDPDAPLDAVEQALVRMFVKILVREIRAGAAWWTDGEVTIVDADDRDTIPVRDVDDVTIVDTAAPRKIRNGLGAGKRARP